MQIIDKTDKNGEVYYLVYKKGQSLLQSQWKHEFKLQKKKKLLQKVKKISQFQDKAYVELDHNDNSHLKSKSNNLELKQQLKNLTSQISTFLNNSLLLQNVNQIKQEKNQLESRLGSFDKGDTILLIKKAVQNEKDGRIKYQVNWRQQENQKILDSWVDSKVIMEYAPKEVANFFLMKLK